MKPSWSDSISVSLIAVYVGERRFQPRSSAIPNCSASCGAAKSASTRATFTDLDARWSRGTERQCGAAFATIEAGNLRWLVALTRRLVAVRWPGGQIVRRCFAIKTSQVRWPANRVDFQGWSQGGGLRWPAATMGLANRGERCFGRVMEFGSQRCGGRQVRRSRLVFGLVNRGGRCCSGA